MDNLKTMSKVLCCWHYHVLSQHSSFVSYTSGLSLYRSSMFSKSQHIII